MDCSRSVLHAYCLFCIKPGIGVVPSHHRSGVGDLGSSFFQEQKRLARVAQEEREKEREATKLRQMLQQHNGKVQAMMSKCDVTGTSGHNSIQQANPQHASKHPVTTVKDAASLTVLSGPYVLCLLAEF